MRGHDRFLEAVFAPIDRLPGWVKCLVVPLSLPLVWPMLLLYVYPMITILGSVVAFSILIPLKGAGLLDQMSWRQMIMLAIGHLWFPSLILIIVSPLICLLVATLLWRERIIGQTSPAPPNAASP